MLLVHTSCPAKCELVRLVLRTYLNLTRAYTLPAAEVVAERPECPSPLGGD